MRRKYFHASLAVLLGISVLPAYAAQLDVSISSDTAEINPSYKFLRIVFFEYPDGGKLGKLLQGKDSRISFTADSTTTGVQEIIAHLNQQFQDSLSGARITDAKITYHATLDVNDKSTSIEYNIEIIPTITNHAIQIDSQTYIDLDWRGIKITGPAFIETEYGEYDINSPESALRVMVPELIQEIQNTDAKKILNIELLDASGISDLPLSKWHSLFDPTAILEEAKIVGFKENSVISYYTMGECNIVVGVCKDRSWTAEFVLDEKYTIKAIESQDDATISIEGYGNLRIIGESEVFQVRQGENVSPGPMQGFPVNIIYGMAGMAAVGGGVIFIISNRKLKKEAGKGQTGIDPSRLRAYQTSASSGGYQTVRGEAQLIDDVDYQKSRSVYDEQKVSETKTKAQSTRGALPKGWN